MVNFIVGIDEAGRGPIIGPLVICAAAIKKEDEESLRILGVKDSKLLSEKQREEILKMMTGKIHYEIKILLPDEIDRAVNSENTNLNWLEADWGADLISKINAKLDNDVVEAVIDCPSTNISAYTTYVKERLNNNDIKLIVEHKADFNHLIVGAASIVAKVTREKELEKLKRKLNVDFGSGYPSDPKTKAFVEKYWNDPKLSLLMRKSWETYKKLAKSKSQKGLGEF